MLVDTIPDSFFQYALDSIILFLGFLWRHTIGRMDKRLDVIEEKQNGYEHACSTCRQENEQHFASQDDLNLIRRDIQQVREDYKTFVQHLDERFNNLTSLIQLIINGKSK